MVITGSTRGLGYAMAKEFVMLGDSVIVSGREQSSVEAARLSLAPLATRNGQQVVGHACDVASSTGCDELASKTVRELGGIDIWVNNAGITQHPKATLATTPASDIQRIVETNMLGTLLGCRAALAVMIEQGRGAIFNMDGAGSRGTATARSATYGATKAAIPQLSQSLAKEIPKSSRVCVHSASPGMVMTDLLCKGAPPSALRIFNILAEKPETTAAWLVPRMRAASDRASGEYLKFLTPAGAAWRFLTAAWRKDRLVTVPPA